MDFSSDTDGPSILFMGPSNYNFFQQSIGCSNELWFKQSVKLVILCFEEVGIGSPVDVHPSK